jgi:hypothetical protein
LNFNELSWAWTAVTAIRTATRSDMASDMYRAFMAKLLSRLLKNSHLAAVLASFLVRRSVLRLRGAFCGGDDLTIFEQPEFSTSC